LRSHRLGRAEEIESQNIRASVSQMRQEIHKQERRRYALPGLLPEGEPKSQVEHGGEEQAIKNVA